VLLAHLWKFIIDLLQHLPLLQHQLVLSPGLSLLQLRWEKRRGGREEDLRGEKKRRCGMRSSVLEGILGETSKRIRQKI